MLAWRDGVLLGAIYGFRHGRCPSEAAITHELTHLVDVGVRAAHEGDCLTVAQPDIELRARDPELHRTVFLQDPAVGRCLEGRFLAACLRRDHAPSGRVDVASIASALFTPPTLEAEQPATVSCPSDANAAAEFTQLAAAAAREGECAIATKLAPLVRELDITVHGEVFARDAAIRACRVP